MKFIVILIQSWDKENNSQEWLKAYLPLLDNSFSIFRLKPTNRVETHIQKILNGELQEWKMPAKFIYQPFGKAFWQGTEPGRTQEYKDPPKFSE